MSMRIISGGQDGVDRAALEVAKEKGVETGGWVPQGWKTEKGPDPSLADFGCVQHPSTSYPPRTEANVQDSHATVWFGTDDSAGYHCTYNACRKHRKALIENPPDGEFLAKWVRSGNFTILNVAGNRRSKDVGGRATEKCRRVLAEMLEVLK